MTFKPDDLRRIVDVIKADTPEFVKLAATAQLDPARDFRRANLRGISLYGENLAGFDFTHCDLAGADLRGADLSGTSGIYEAILTDIITNDYTIWPLKTQRIRIVNRRGLHVRAAARFVMVAERFAATIMVTCGEDYSVSVPASSLVGLLMFGASRGTEIQLSGAGKDAGEAIDALSALITDGFGQDDIHGSFAFRVGKLRESIASETYEPAQRATVYEAIKSLVPKYKGTGNPLEDDRFIESLERKYGDSVSPFLDFLEAAQSTLADTHHPFKRAYFRSCGPDGQS